VPARALGKGLRKGLPVDVWGELQGICAGATTADTWEALFGTMAHFRRVAHDVGDRLGYAYPDELDERVTAYVRRLLASKGARGVAAEPEDRSRPTNYL
jgi:aminoglycoside 6-adenylyltransferase